MKRIAIFLPNLKGGGAEKVFYILANQFQSYGFYVDFILCNKEGEFLDMLDKRIQVHDLNVSRIRHAIFPLIKFLNKNTPEVFIAGMWPLTIISLIANFFSKHSARIIVSDHNTLSLSARNQSVWSRFFLGLSIRLFYPMASKRLAVSNGVAEDICQLSHLAIENYTVIHNPIILESNHRIKVRERKACHRIINVGSLKAQKNHQMLLEAFKLLISSVDAELIILGEGEFKDKLSTSIENLGLSARVHLVGFQENLLSWYESSDLFVLSSDYEGFGNVIVEALHCGLPVVSTDCPSGPREILGDNEFGTLVPVGDAQALADAMLESLNTEHDIEKLKARAADFSVEKIARQYLEVMFPEEKGAETGTNNG